jgi:hypothetical protein
LVPSQYLNITGRSINFKLYQNMHLFKNCFVCKMLEYSFTVLANCGICLKSWQSNVLWDSLRAVVGRNGLWEGSALSD